MSMMSSATRHSSGAAPCRSLAPRSFLSLERGIERGSERRFAVDERIPAELLALSLALRHELQPLGRDGEHVGPARDLDLALQRFVEPGCHEFLKDRNSLTSSGS